MRKVFPTGFQVSSRIMKVSTSLKLAVLAVNIRFWFPLKCGVSPGISYVTNGTIYISMVAIIQK